jgi:hypothetical protein
MDENDRENDYYYSGASHRRHAGAQPIPTLLTQRGGAPGELWDGRSRHEVASCGEGLMHKRELRSPGMACAPVGYAPSSTSTSTKRRRPCDEVMGILIPPSTGFSLTPCASRSTSSTATCDDAFSSGANDPCLFIPPPPCGAPRTAPIALTAVQSAEIVVALRCGSALPIPTC